MSPLDLDRITTRVRNEFLEMPGLQVSFAQMSRLFGLPPTICQAVVEILLGTAFLRRTPGDMLARATGEPAAARH